MHISLKILPVTDNKRGEAIELPIFVVCSVLILFISRKGLRDRHSYGYYRFFALEFILLLVVTNLRVWFDDPFSVIQILSWISLAGSLYLVISGFKLIGFSKASDKVDSSELIESGIYGTIRHPLYSSLMFLALGAYLKKPSLFSTILLFGAIFTLMTTVKAEEAVDAQKFGPRYGEYAQRTKMFIPYIF